MKGVVFTGNREIEFQDFADPKPGPGEVVIEIKASGMCGSDLHLYRSPGGGPAMAAALGLGGDGQASVGGHEPCGVVVERGAGVPKHVAPDGARVMVHHYSGCETCADCRGGWPQLCQVGPMQVYGVTANGAHSSHMAIPAFTLVSLPDELSFETGAAISCGTGTAYGALKRMKMDGGRTLAVFGQGPVGTSATMLGKAMGMHVFAIDISDERLALAKKCGADAVINVASKDAVEELRKLTGGKGVHYAVECSSNPDARGAAVQGTRTWGTVCYVGEGGTVQLEVSPDMIRRQVTLMGSWTFSTNIQDECTKFISDNGVPVDDIITDRFKLSDAVGAYQKFDKQQMGKGMLKPD
ncbi:MAG: zinc-dependent alcohol dehydrogenase family protein [Hyphomicrobiaceae bacterium]